MKKFIEIVPEIENECIATYHYAIRNFQPAAVRRSLKRAMQRGEQGPDCALQVEIGLKKGAPEIPKWGRHFTNATCGGVLKGCLEIIDPEAMQEQAEAGEDCTIFLPLASVESMQVEYRQWEPLNKSKAAGGTPALPIKRSGNDQGKTGTDSH